MISGTMDESGQGGTYCHCTTLGSKCHISLGVPESVLPALLGLNRGQGAHTLLSRCTREPMKLTWLISGEANSEDPFNKGRRDCGVKCENFYLERIGVRKERTLDAGLSMAVRLRGWITVATLGSG